MSYDGQALPFDGASKEDDLEELFVFTDGEEYVIAKDEADARMVYEATGAIIPSDVAWERCDPETSFTFYDDDTRTKTFGQWARERGRGYFAGSL